MDRLLIRPPHGTFEQVAPVISIDTPIQLSLSARHERLPSRFVGMESGAYWIVADPLKHADAPYPIEPGSPISVRYRYRGAVYGFVAELVARIDFPGRLLFLRCPELVARHVLRTTPRIECQLPCTVVADDRELTGKLLDISSEGCRCALRLQANQVTRPFSSGDDVILNLKLPGIAYEQILWGEVKNLKTDAEQIRFGLRFDQLDIDAQARLAEFLQAVGDL